MNEKPQPKNEPIKRVTWLDLYIINDKDKKILGTKFDDAIEEASTAKNTPGVIKILNRLAFTDGISKKEKFAWLRIKSWIFEQVIINKDEETTRLANPEQTDEEIKRVRDFERTGKGIDFYGAKQGSYGLPMFADLIELLDYQVSKEQIEKAKQNEKLPSIETPGNFEYFIANRLLEIKKIKKGPVIFIDFGGVMGGTTLRLAEKFKEEIQRGEMVFIVTNLLADKTEVIEYAEKNRYADKIETMKLVHYVQADAEELQSISILLPSGENFSINGNVDFIHDQNAITAHGGANDRDFTILGKMLSRYGLLALSKRLAQGSKALDSNLIKSVFNRVFTLQKGYTGINGKHPEIKKESRIFNWIDAKKIRAYRNLIDLGLINIDALPLNNGRAIELMYSFFVKPNAPNLKITDRFGHEHEIHLNSEAKMSKLNYYTSKEIRDGWRKEGK